MTEYVCPDCGGGFPQNGDEVGCPWCGLDFGAYEPPEQPKIVRHVDGDKLEDRSGPLWKLFE